jgi:Tfp pilus assembly PilM family ATPase
MAGYENHAGFNITSSKLQVVEVNYIDDQFRLVNVDEAKFEQNFDFEHDQDLKLSTLLQGAFQKLNLNKKLNSSTVSFILPFELFYIAQLSYDTSLLYQDLVEEFKWELSLLYPFVSNKDLVLQYYEVEKNQFNTSNTALVFGLQRKYLQILESFCKNNSLKLKFVDHPHISSERALSVTNANSGKALNLSIYLVKDYLSLLFSFNGKPISLKGIPLNDISEITDLLVKEISQSSDLNIVPSQIQSVYISGNDVTPGLILTLKKALGMDFVSFNPFDKIRPITDLYESKLYLENYNTFSAAAGIAFRLS